MSDSGRVLGDCKHGRTRERCDECRIEELWWQRDVLLAACKRVEPLVRRMWPGDRGDALSVVWNAIARVEAAVKKEG